MLPSLFDISHPFLPGDKADKQESVMRSDNEEMKKNEEKKFFGDEADNEIKKEKSS